MLAVNKTIAQKTAELFDSEDFNLEIALEKFNQAEKLAVNIEKDLNQIKNEISIVKKKFDKEA